MPLNLKDINTTPAENKVTEPRSMLRGDTFIGIQTSSLHSLIRYETTRELLLLLADPYFLNPGIRQLFK